MTELSVKRKPDRSAMAAMISDAVEPIGVAVHREESIYRPRLIRLTLSLRGVDCYIDIDGDRSPHSAFIASWVSDKRLEPSFGADIRGSVNMHHGCKATTVESDFVQFVGCVERGFELVANEMAFEEEEQVA